MLGVHKSTYYYHQQEKKTKNRAKKSDTELLKKIKQIKLDHPFWGYRRVWAWLVYQEKIVINHKKVYRLMKENNLLVEQKRYKAKRKSTHPKPRPTRPNQWWGTDMTKFFVNQVGWVYVIFVLDWFTRKIVGYKLSLRCRSQEWIEALEMAVQTQCPQGAREYQLNLMSDNGSQPTSQAYMNVCNTLEINHITTSYSNPKGNAETERLIRTFKEEVVWPNEFDQYSETIAAVENFIDFYNHQYPHSSLGYLSPVEFEKNYVEKLAA